MQPRRPVLLVVALLLAYAHRLPAQELDLQKAIVYAERGDTKLALDLYRPKTPGPHPLCVVIHGGAWRIGARDRGEAVPLATSLARAGIAAASISYRLVPKGVWPAQIDDCRRAVQFLRAEAARFDLDAQRVGAMGASAGGHLAGLLATMDDAADAASEDPVARMSTRLRCAVSFFGPTTLEPDEKISLRGVQVVNDLFGGHIAEEDPATALPKLRGASPLFHLTPDDPPMLLVHGTRDPVVPFDQSERMNAALAKAGIAHDFVAVSGGGHGDFMAAFLQGRQAEPPEWWRRTKDFLEKKLVAKPEAGADAPAAAGAAGQAAPAGPAPDGR